MLKKSFPSNSSSRPTLDGTGPKTFQVNYKSRNGSWRRTDHLFVPSVPHGQFFHHPPNLKAFLIPHPDLRFGWNQINLTLVANHFDSRVLHVKKITTGLDFNPRGSINLTVKGVNPFVNCNDTDGFRGYNFPSFAPSSNMVFAFFWNETKNTTLEEEEFRQYIIIFILPEEVIVTTFPGGERTSPSADQKTSHGTKTSFI